MNQTALLIVDVQNGLFNKTTTIYQADEMLEHINLLEDKARQKGSPIVYIQHKSKSLVPGNEDFKLHPKLKPKKTDIFIEKTTSCGFDDNNLKEQLLDLSVTDVVICGLVSHGCVKRTCLGAADHGFNVYLAADAHSNWRKDAKDLIDQVNLELDSQGIIIKTSDEIEF